MKVMQEDEGHKDREIRSERQHLGRTPKRRRHPLVLRTEEALKSRGPDKYGMLRPREEGCLDIRVGPKSVARALRIMNRVLRALEKTGQKIVVASERKPRTMAMVDGEEIPFSLWEGSKRTEHVPTKQQQEDAKKHPYRTFDRWDFRPSGDLTLEISRWGFWGVRRTWSDGKRRQLEHQLDSFLHGMRQASAKAKEIRAERERERQAREVEERKRLDERRRQAEEQRRVQVLNQQVANWRHRQLVHQFVAMVKEAAFQRHGAIEPGSPLDEWMAWASRYANSLDPLDSVLSKLSHFCPTEGLLGTHPAQLQDEEATVAESERQEPGPVSLR